MIQSHLFIYLEPKALDLQLIFISDLESFLFHLEHKALNLKSFLFYLEPGGLDLKSIFIYEPESFLFHLELGALESELFFYYYLE